VTQHPKMAKTRNFSKENGCPQCGAKMVREGSYHQLIQEKSRGRRQRQMIEQRKKVGSDAWRKLEMELKWELGDLNPENSRLAKRQTPVPPEPPPPGPPIPPPPEPPES
jgi:hypothetical protein